MALRSQRTNYAWRRWLPLLLAGVLALLSVAAWHVLGNQQRTQLQIAISEEANNAGVLIKRDLDNRVLALNRLARRWAQAGGTPRATWESDVVNYLVDQPGYQAIEWADPSLVIRWVVPLEGNEAAQNLDLAGKAYTKVAPEAARDGGTTAFSRPIDLVQGGKGIVAYVPIVRGDEFDGLMIGVLRLQKWLDIVTAVVPASHYSVTVSIAGEKVYQRVAQASPTDEKWRQGIQFDLYGLQWRVQLWPSQQRLEEYNSPIVALTLIAGLLLSGLIGYATYLAQAARHRARQLQQEIAARRQADEELRNSHELLEQRVEQRTAELSAYLESAPDAMLIVDSSGAVQLANAQASDLFGYSQEELHGITVEALIPERFRTGHIEQRSGFFASPQARPMGTGMELFALAKNGEEIPIEVSLSPITVESGNVVYAALRDITERKQAADQLHAATQQLQQAKEEAERANAAKSRFLATASHDLRQPLQSLNLLNSALGKTIEGAKAQKMLRMQGESLAGMSNLLNSLLDISRLESGGVVPKFNAVALQPVFARMRADFEQQAKAKGVRLNIEPTTHIAHTDPDLLAQMILNLVANAIRYTNSGSVTLRSVEQEQRLRIEVSDTGIGIAADQLHRIFDEFHQVNRDPQQRDEGLGLGLAIVQRIASLLHTEVQVESEQGKGSMFTFALEISATAAQQPAIASVDNDAQPTVGGTVLLLDDDPGVLESSQLLLEIEGFDVPAALTPAAAFAHVERLTSAPAIIVTDYHLGAAETGIDVVRCIRERVGYTVPAILVTGDTSPSISEFDIDNVQLLNKPITANELLDLMRQLLRSVTN